MKNLVLAGTIGAAAILAACSSGPDYSALEGSEISAAEPVKPATPARTSTPSPIPTPLPIPTSGPGSNGSPARQFFIAQVHPSLSPTCASCHSAGLNGAPVILQGDAATSYQTLDVRAMIQPNSILKTRGLHVGPALTAPQLTLVQQWLDLEAKERVGQAAPVNILEKIGDCLDEALFNVIKFEELRTQPGENEDADQCTGCKNAQCNVCHTAGDGNFYMGLGSGLDKATFVQTKQARFVSKYIGINGTTPVPSNALKLKSDSTVLDPMHYHPMFKLSGEMQKGIDDFAKAAIFAYQAGTCGK